MAELKARQEREQREADERARKDREAAEERERNRNVSSRAEREAESGVVDWLVEKLSDAKNYVKEKVKNWWPFN